MPAVLEANPIQRAGRREWLGLAVLMLPVLLISVDNTVLSFAIPSLSRALAPTGTELLWIVDIYALVLAGLLVPMGALGDRIGRRKLLLIGTAGSGKTKVLVDRLLLYLTDENDPANLDDFLIITYTKAAASELRGKIAAKLKEKIDAQ